MHINADMFGSENIKLTVGIEDLQDRCTQNLNELSKILELSMYTDTIVKLRTNNRVTYNTPIKLN